MLPDPAEIDQRVFPKFPPPFSPKAPEGPQAFGIWLCDGQGGTGDPDPALVRAALGAPYARPAAPDAEADGTGSDGRAAVTPAGERDSLAEKWRLRLRDGKPWDHEYRVFDGKGRMRHLLSRGVQVRASSGDVLGWIGVDLDITDIRDAEEELRLSQDRFRVALESGCDLLYECDMVTGVRRWFGPVDELLGFGRDEFERTQAAWETALHPEDRDRVLEVRRRHLDGSSPFQVEYRIRRRDGEAMHWLDRGKAMRDRDGSPVLWIGFVTDMTERRRAEEMIRKSEERRRASQRLEVIGRLAGGIAHDFNNLLTAVNGYGELVLAQLEDGSDLAPHVKEILRAGERAATLTRQLLAFSRRQVLAPKVLDLNALIRDLRKMLGEFIGPSIEIRFHPGAQVSRIKADPAQVEQVIVNLALNAKDAMPQGGWLLITTEEAELRPGDALADAAEGELRPGRYVLLSVRDSGVGMDEETKSHLFEPFYTTKGRAQGLGLSAVYGIVKQSGGHITVTSDRGEGAALRLYWPRFDGALPRFDGAQAETGPEGLLVEAPGYGGYGPGAPLVLIAEDEDSQRALVRGILESRGYAVLVAGSGQEALDLAHQAGAPIDLLLADVVMPGMGGLELARTLQDLLPGVKVLFMSGFTDHQHVREGILECNRDFIGKPFSHEDLLAKVQAVLEVKRAA
ncbi:MAG TPA: PAS domain-containing protein [Fibrobacteria bacterium]|nr:PAS domain-containing protein [Fibrobacteria bacterium]